MSETLIFWIIVLAVLWIGIGMRNRALGEDDKRRGKRSKNVRPVGNVLDTSSVSKRIHRVRRDHLASSQCRGAPSPSDKSRLVTKARRAVTKLGYFQHHEPEHEG